MALPATDNFTATNGTNLSTYNAAWTQVAGTFAINTNAVYPASGSGDFAAHWNADAFNNDQYSRATVVAIASGAYIGVAVRCHASLATWYEVLGDGADATYFYKVVNGVGTELASPTAALAVNDVIEIRAVGTTISWYKNGTLMQSVTDASIGSGAAGIAGAGASTGSRLDTWQGGNYGLEPIEATASITLEALTVAATAEVPIVGDADITLGALTISATADVGEVTITATADITLGALTLSATADVPVVADANITLGALVLEATGHQLSNASINGVLRVSSNGRYFENDNGPLVLAGMHTWYDVQDGGPSDPPPTFDWGEYIEALIDYGHNCTKLWMLETARDWAGFAGEYFGLNPYARTGPGNAADGKPKFDLDAWNESYFNRLRTRAIEAGNAGIYVIVQLFQGWHIESKDMSPGDPWAYHPFNAANNINSVNGDTNSNGKGLELRDVSQTALFNRSKLLVDKMIATVGDLDNVIWEVSNEDTHSSTALTWQRAIAAYIKDVEDGRPKQHPVGITKLYPGGNNSDLFASADADWTSIDDDQTPNPDLADGSKVVLWDTDHVFGVTSTYQWIMRSFAQGNNPLFMDVWDGAIYGTDTREDDDYILIRRLLGDVVAYGERMDLANVTPQPSLSSTGWCLAKTSGTAPHLFVYQGGSGAFNVTLTGIAGTFDVEWFRVSNGAVQSGSTVNGNGVRTLTPPWSGPVVAFLTQEEALEPIEGNADIELGALLLAATATVEIVANADITLNALIVAATGEVPIVANADIVLEALIVEATADVLIEGNADIELGVLVVEATATVGNVIEANANITLEALFVEATAEVPIIADASITLAPLLLAATGVVEVVGMADIVLGALVVSATESGIDVNVPVIRVVVYGPSSRAIIYS